MTSVTIEEMERDLERLGWKKYGGTLAWQSPAGSVFRGPYKAWCVATGREMSYQEEMQKLTKHPSFLKFGDV